MVGHLGDRDMVGEERMGTFMDDADDDVLGTDDVLEGGSLAWRSGILTYEGMARGAHIQWLCWICAREVVGGHVPWVSRACRNCWGVNKKAGRLFGGDRIWPLGLYSLMNGVGIQLWGGGNHMDARIQQFVDQFRAMTSMADTLEAWAATERARMGARAGLTSGAVSRVWWEARFPSSSRASASAFARLTRTHQPWLIEIDPRVADIAWLAEPDEPDDED